MENGQQPTGPVAPQGPAPSSELFPKEQPVNVFERMDRAVFRALYFGTRNPVFNVLMPALSIMANRGALTMIAGALLLLLGGDAVRQAAVEMMAAAGIAGVLAEGTIKFIWKRKRPFMVMEDVRPLVPSKRLVRRPSFPSGHSAGYIASAVALALTFPSVAPYVLTLGVLGSFSRIYNGVHFPSDVLAGMAIGAASAVAVLRFMPQIF